jgi:prepilin-type processing-associated H-X9-DG protein
MWSIVKDYAVIGSSAGVYEAAVKRMTASGEDHKSIRDTEGYKEVAAKLPDGLVAMSYTDSQTQYTQTMVQLQQFWPMAVMFAAKAGVTLPAMLPQLGPIIKDMKPSSRLIWMGPDGLYSQYRGPGVEVGLASVAGVSIGAAVMMPALAHTRERAKEVASMSNLKQIGLALIMYADDNNDNLPADLQAAQKHLSNPQALESPRKPKDFSGPSYIYIPGQTLKMDAQNVLAYENPEFSGDKINALFLDGHVEAMKPDQFRKALEATYKRLGKPMPEVRFKGEKETKP